MTKTLSIVVPVYQNAANLPETIPNLLGLANRIPGYRIELVFVDDGSRDSSLRILSEFAVRHPEQIVVVKLTRNFGQTPAIQAGLRHANGDCVGVISADLQEPYEMFVDMVGEWEKGAKYVIGERQAREENRGHQLVSSIYWNLIRHFAFADFPQMGYDFFLADRQVVNDINRINEKNSSIFALLFWLGYRPVRLPITRKLRSKGTSQWKFWRKVALTVDTLIAFTTLPARLITAMGFTIATLCIVYLVFMLGQWYFFKAAPPGWMTVVGLLSLLGAIILFSLGIVSEYLVRILDEARKRPPFVVESLTGPSKSKPLPTSNDTE